MVEDSETLDNENNETEQEGSQEENQQELDWEQVEIPEEVIAKSALVQKLQQELDEARKKAAQNKQEAIKRRLKLKELKNTGKSSNPDNAEKVDPEKLTEAVVTQVLSRLQEEQRKAAEEQQKREEALRAIAKDTDIPLEVVSALKGTIEEIEQQAKVISEKQVKFEATPLGGSGDQELDVDDFLKKLDKNLGF